MFKEFCRGPASCCALLFGLFAIAGCVATPGEPELEPLVEAPAPNPAVLRLLNQQTLDLDALLGLNHRYGGRNSELAAELRDMAQWKFEQLAATLTDPGSAAGRAQACDFIGKLPEWFARPFRGCDGSQPDSFCAAFRAALAACPAAPGSDGQG